MIEIERLKKVTNFSWILKSVKVYIAIKRKLMEGDKMAGRHGNKGVISRILPEEDMPYFTDGTPVDIILNPLGVPSRLNVGQVLETHLGWAAWGLGEKVNALLRQAVNVETIRRELKGIYSSPETDAFIDEATDEEIIAFARRLWEGVPIVTPVFDGANEGEIVELLNQAELSSTGQTVLFDGRTGGTI